nr:magnesium-chelatase subunit ChlD, chloroplastic [Ipomoea batatas]
MYAAGVAKCLASLEGRDKANVDDLKKVVSYVRVGPVKRLAVDATLRAAAPYQKLCREKGIQKSRKVFVEKTDIESQKNGMQSGSLGRSHYSLSAQPASVLIPLVSSFLLTIYINPI